MSAPVDIRPLPGAWVAELLGVVLGDQKKDQNSTASILVNGSLKGW